MFSYDLDALLEDGFARFLAAYHEVYSITREELEFVPEAYRFFILNYAVKHGRYFFQDVYASKLEREAVTRYFPQLQQGLDVERLAKACGL